MLESTITFEAKPVRYFPALGVGYFTRFFDTFQKWAAKEDIVKPELIGQACIQVSNKVLDLGCGTGTLTLLAKKSQPFAEVTGIDIDPQVLGIAKAKAAQICLDIQFDIGTAYNLPYPDNSFDRVISSLVLHHLTRENKIRALREVHRVLKTNGELHVADIGKPQNLLMRLPSAIMRRLEETEDNIKGLIPQMLKIAGFQDIEESSRFMTLFGTVSLYSAGKRSTPF